MAAEHILVVEDENIIAKDLQQRLTTLGYTVSAIVSSGPDALQKAAELPLDLVLMDIVLKGDMDGVETAEHLRTRFGIPIVYLTAYADPQTLQRAKVTEPLGYLLKPIVDRQLQTTIEMALYQHKRDRSLKAHAEHRQETLLIAGKFEAIGSLAGGMAHRFNSLLRDLIGHLASAKMQARPREPVFRHLTEAERTAQQALHTTRQLLTFSNGEEPVKQPTAIRALLHDTTAFVRTHPGIRLRMSYAPDLWVVQADRRQLRQLIHNVTRNAMEAMPAGGLLQVDAVNSHIDARSPLPLAPGAYVNITVRDQGEGIPPAAHQRLFDAYFSTKRPGRGLGLTTAYAIVQNHQGHIRIDSALGVGTRVSIYLPASPNTSLPGPMPPRAPSAGSRKILIMDDEGAIRMLLREMLQRLGYDVESVNNGEAAIALYRRAQEAGEPFAAVVMDLVIPGGMGGKETMRQLLAIDPAVKAIVSSGYSHDPIMADFANYGFCGVLPKPYRLPELSAVLQQVLSRV